MRCLAESFRVVSRGSAEEKGPVARAAPLSAHSWDWTGSEVNPTAPSFQLSNRMSRKQEARTGKEGVGLSSLGGESGGSLLMETAGSQMVAPLRFDCQRPVCFER